MAIKKLISVAVFILFLLSVLPSGLAYDGEKDEFEEGTDKDNREENIVKTVQRAQERVELFREKTEARLEQAEKHVDRAEEQFAERAEKATSRAEKVQERIAVLQEKVAERREAAQEKLADAKERYHEAKERYEEQKQRVSELKDQFQRCQKAEGTENVSDGCKKAEDTLKEGAQKHLLNILTVMDRTLERLEERVMNTTGIADEDRTAALESIAALQQRVAEQKAAVENSTVSQKEAVKAAKELWNDIKREQKAIIALLVQDKSAALLEKHRGLERSMEAKIASIERAGGDATELQAILERFRTQIAELEEAYADAKARWQLARGSEKREAWEAWRDAQKEFRDGLQESREILREFVKKFVELKKELGADEIGESNEMEETAGTENGTSPPGNESAENETAANESTETGETAENETSDGSAAAGNETATENGSGEGGANETAA
ncbi:hypothetical protein HYS49_01395 [Candidatus Woesearchaeota archaeon]|nr:hypothetical protein [Candidatus Woesearchaeota archaeon]